MQRELLKMGAEKVVGFREACTKFFPEFDPDIQIYCIGDSPENIRRAAVVQASVSRSLKRLEERGLVERFRGAFTTTLDGMMEQAVRELTVK